MSSFEGIVARGAAWAFASSWARILISLLAFALIARIIGPESYGQNTMAGALAALGQVFVGPAMGEVIVQRAAVSERLLSAYFWLLQLLGLVVFALLFGLRETIAAAAGSPLVAPLLGLYAMLVPITALQTIPEARLSRDMQFRAQALGGGAGVLAGGASGIALALHGAGAWSLLALQLVQSVVQAVVVWHAAAWRPAAAPQWRDLPPLLHYSASSLSARMLNEFDGQLPKMLIGALLGVTALGYYALARRVFDLLKDMLIVPLNMLALPSLARARSHGEDLPKLFGAALRLSTAIANPAFIGLITIAPLLVPVAFGGHWMAAVPALQLMALIGLRTAVNSFNGAALRVSGQPWQQVAVAALGVVLVVAGVNLAAPYGLLAAVAAVVVRSYLTWPLTAWLVSRQGVFPAARQFTVGLPSLAAAVIMGAAITALLPALRAAMPDAAALAVSITLGMTLYAVSLRLVAADDFNAAQAIARQLASRFCVRRAMA